MEGINLLATVLAWFIPISAGIGLIGMILGAVWFMRKHREHKREMDEMSARHNARINRRAP